MENKSIGQPRILVVDDEPRMCKRIRALLSVQDHEVFTAFSGNDALDLLRRRSFDTALRDLMLPGMDGYQIMERIHESDPEFPVIMITGRPSVKVAVNALKRGAYDFIRKPFECDELLMTLQNALSQRALKREKEVINGRLAQTEERYRFLVENSPDIIYTLDEEGRFTFVSDAIGRILGLKTDDILGKHFSTLVNENDHGKAGWCFNERRTGNRAASGVEFRLRAGKNGGKSEGNDFRVCTVELKAMGMCDSNAPDEKKRFLGTHGVVRDITERRNLESKLKQAERMESLGTLAGGIAHDFNNLLMGIQGNASLALLEMPDGHPTVERLMNIEKLVQSGSELTKRLLGFARGGKYQVKPTDIRELVSKDLSLFRRTKKEITVFEEYCDSPWTVEVDRAQVDQVFLNLFVNAWQAMPGGGELHVAIRNVLLSRNEVAPYELQSGKYVMISVKDTGVGMDKATCKRIFEPFLRQEGREEGRVWALRLPTASSNTTAVSSMYKAKRVMGPCSAFTCLAVRNRLVRARRQKRGFSRSAGYWTSPICNADSHVCFPSTPGYDPLRACQHTAVNKRGGSVCGRFHTFIKKIIMAFSKTLCYDTRVGSVVFLPFLARKRQP